ncbi:GNAT family N-acetyltransferase [Leucobacter coleopterorum]|uniref:GNAT family N-acetyltransferase n=1 Tax=Leucobacter coleopterorum TaxID=2714933 RepID=A0ABX6K1Q8_9MICO|nr:GNAT family N-acetyltransferase [Leucobacter coleopterorum]QIM19177.1 GNAT family N-acetyltransferase [Leucobacter coleopterorum]
MINIIPADFHDQRLISFLEDHLADLAPTAPIESRHALDLSALQRPEVRMWSAVDDERIVGTVALAGCGEGCEELKSMRTDPARRGQGIASRLLQHALEDARARGISEVFLETGTMEFFAAARKLYRAAGFQECPPFGSYSEDSNSVFMKLVL